MGGGLRRDNNESVKEVSDHDHHLHHHHTDDFYYPDYLNTKKLSSKTPLEQR